MRKKAISVAAVYQTPFYRLIDFMYGTPERSRFTICFALGMLALSVALQTGDHAYCSIDQLAK